MRDRVLVIGEFLRKDRRWYATESYQTVNAYSVIAYFEGRTACTCPDLRRSAFGGGISTVH